ncbi:MAG: CpaF family protein [Candidatus Diapherotrites archaeon]|nr:CpaF family protein [Candidatus Diapherotrites archaeon]
MTDYLDDLIKKAKAAKKQSEAESIAEPQRKPVLEPKNSPKKQEVSWATTPATNPASNPLPTRDPFSSPAQMPRQQAGMVSTSAPSEENPEKSALEAELENAKKVEIASYGETKIYKVAGHPMLYYFVPVPRPTASEKAIISTIKEAATRLITIAPYRIRDPEQRKNVYYQRVMDILKSSPELKIPQHRFDFYANAVVRDMVGYGLIDPLVNDDKLEEIMIIGPKMPVYVFHREYEMMLTNIEFFNDNEIQDLINRVARQIGRRIDISAPLLDARLPDGSRVNATIPPASVQGSTLTIRKFKKDPYSLIDLINYNTLSVEAAAFLWTAVEGVSTTPANILISGGTGSGKTTLLNVLSSMIPSNERIISIEDTAELSLPLKHWVRMEARPPGLEGKGELTIDILTKNSLRMRPDRIIVGEIRHDEAFTLFTAMNTGHDGSMGTVHANSAAETIIRVTNPPMNVPEVMLSGLDFVIIENRLHDRKKGTIRRVTEISEVTGVLEKKAQTQTIFERDPTDDTLKRTQIPSQFMGKLCRMTGMTKKQLDAIIEERTVFLKKLVDSNIRSMPEVSSALQHYLSEKRSE